jgi:hypothetical protein
MWKQASECLVNLFFPFNEFRHTFKASLDVGLVRVPCTVWVFVLDVADKQFGHA